MLTTAKPGEGGEFADGSPQEMRFLFPCQHRQPDNGESASGIAGVCRSYELSGRGNVDRQRHQRKQRPEGRPAYNRLLEMIGRKEIDIVLSWSVDRISRSLPDLLAFLGELKAKNVDLFLHQNSLDTSTPGGKALFQMLGVFSELGDGHPEGTDYAGLDRARAEGKKLGQPQCLEHPPGHQLGQTAAREANAHTRHREKSADWRRDRQQDFGSSIGIDPRAFRNGI